MKHLSMIIIAINLPAHKYKEYVGFCGKKGF